MSNTIKTTILLAALTGLLMAIGNYFGGQQGMFLALILAAVMNFGAYWFSDKMVLAMFRAQEVSPAEAPYLHSIVEGLARRAGVPKPRVYLIPTRAPNAFATGRDPAHAAVAVTEGLLGLLNQAEVEAVLAHEMAHVRHRDTLISAIAATLAGALTMMAHWLRWMAFFGGMGRDDEERSRGLEMLVLAIVVPIAAMIIQLAVSRSREYAADAAGAALSGNPLALASALQKLDQAAHAMPMEANPATSHLFIVNPFSGASLLRLLSTHPSTEDRVARLQAMAIRFGPYGNRSDRYFA